MNKGLTFFIIVAIGLGLCVAGYYYIFWYEAPKSISPLGIVVNPFEEDLDGEYYDQIDEEYSEREVGVVQLFVDWGDVEKNEEEYNWAELDQEIKFFNKRGYRVSLCVKNINGYALGDFPEDFVYVDLYNKVYQERFSDFVLTLLDKHGDKIDYLVLGSEVNKYLSIRTDQIEAFSLFYNTIYYRAKTDYPNIQIGTSFSYDVGLDRDSLILEEDFIGFTFYNNNSQSEVLNVDQADQAFNKMLEKAGDKKLALISTGLSSAESANSSSSKQGVFIDKLIKFVVSNKEEIEFANYYFAEDKEACVSFAENQLWNKLFNSDVCQNSPLRENACSKEMVSSEEREKFSSWLCAHGLRNEVGVPKEGFYSWLEAIQDVNFE